MFSHRVFTQVCLHIRRMYIYIYMYIQAEDVSQCGQIPWIHRFHQGCSNEVSLHQKGFGKPSQVTFFDQKGQAVGKEWFPNIDLSEEKRNNKYMFTKEKPLYKYL